jgi:hypothetical protein
MTRTIAATISDDAYRIWDQVPHGRKSALIQNLLKQWSSTYEKDRHSGDIIVPKTDRLTEIEARVKQIVEAKKLEQTRS